MGYTIADIKKDPDGLWACPYCGQPFTDYGIEQERSYIEYVIYGVYVEGDDIIVDVLPDSHHMVEEGINPMTDVMFFCTGCEHTFEPDYQHYPDLEEMIIENHKTLGGVMNDV